MEFKKRLTQKRKGATVRAMKEDGRIRVKVRGRKRWIKSEKQSA